MDKIKTWIFDNKLHIIYGGIILVLILGLVLQYKFSTSTPPVATIEDTTPTSVASGQAAVGKYTGKDDAADVSNLITKAQQSTPTAVFYTATQAAADKQAQIMSKTDKADYVLKETKAKDPAAAPSGSEQIQNNYYAIQQERKHRLAAGVTAIDGKAYATVAYTNDRLTYELHSKDLKNIDGASVMYTVKKW
jgi:hypothetical protein